LPGDIFGIENGEVYRFSADAIQNTTVGVARRLSLFGGFTQRESGFTTNLLGLVTRNLQHAEDHMLLLGRKTAVEKVATFLLEMDERIGSPTVMILPMNRRDIADYLGLTLETVSRALAVKRVGAGVASSGSRFELLKWLFSSNEQGLAMSAQSALYGYWRPHCWSTNCGHCAGWSVGTIWRALQSETSEAA
jgi:CRP-like cAMP-binding protein